MIALMEHFQEVLAKWPSLDDVAADTKANVVAVRKWWQRNAIPSRFWLPLVAGAKQRNIRGITVEALAAIDTATPQRKKRGRAA